MTEPSNADGIPPKVMADDAPADKNPSVQDQQTSITQPRVENNVSEERDRRGQQSAIATTTTTDRAKENQNLELEQQNHGNDKKILEEVDSKGLAALERKDKEPNPDHEEKMKHARRKRRCPIVEIQDYLHNRQEQDECKEGGGTTRKHRSLARMIMQEDIPGFMHLVHEGTCASDSSDEHGWTALHWASSRGSTVMTYAILQEIRLSQETVAPAHERDDDAPDPVNCLNLPEHLNGWTPLHLAAIGGHLDVVYLLMDAGCDPDIRDRMGDRPVNCIKRNTRKRGGSVERLRNALLDLSDTEDSGNDETTVISSARPQTRTTVAAARPPYRG